MPARNLRSVVARNIRLLRTINDWQQSDLAKLIRMSQRTVSNWENEHAEPSLNNIARLADAFGVQPHLLLTEMSEAIAPRRSA